MSKKFFWGKKSILSSGREVDLSCDEEREGVVSVLAIMNHLDCVHEITKPISIRIEWKSEDSDGEMSIECRGGSPREGRPISESELPVEGLNGFKDTLKNSEFRELLDLMDKIHKKIRKEVSA